MRILIVEDDATSREFLLQLVEKHGYEGVPAENGERAWEALSAADAPSLVLLDRVMPGMDGEELCRRVRAAPRTVPPYIVMLTVKGEKADIISGLDAGADDYISKPFDPDELRARINVGRRVLDLETALAARVKEKELLLQEVHHRIKNNMNTMCSILELQSSRIDNPAASAALRDANSRLVSMGVLYDKLYRQENVREMRVAEYVPALLREIIGQFPNRGSVRVELDIGDFSLPPKTLSSIGIIVNELATNAMKYAFPDGREGVIRFSASASDSLAAFSLEDDGIGIPASVDCRGSSGFGLGLVALMAEQIGASIEISREAGTRFEFRLTI